MGRLIFLLSCILCLSCVASSVFANTATEKAIQMLETEKGQETKCLSEKEELLQNNSLNETQLSHLKEQIEDHNLNLTLLEEEIARLSNNKKRRKNNKSEVAINNKPKTKPNLNAKNFDPYERPKSTLHIFNY